MKKLQILVIASFMNWGLLPQGLWANSINCGDEFFDSGGANSNYQNEVNNETITFCPQISGEAVSINFTEFELENNGDNCYDQLMIFNGDDVTHTAIASPNGTTKGWCWDKQVGSEGGSGNLEGLTLTSTDDSGCLTFVFNSDGLVTRSGWKASVTCIQMPSCPTPNNLNVTNITHNSAELQWEIGGGTNQANSNIEWGIAGFSIGTGESASVSENSFQLINLSSLTTYQFYVQDDCTSDGASAWVGPFEFVTSCAPFQGDSFNDPVQINSLPFSVSVNTNECFTNQIGQDSPDAFYSFTTSSCADKIVFTTCSISSDFDTYIRLLDDAGNELATNDDSETLCDFTLNGENRFSKIHFDVNPNTIYTAVVEGFGLKTGNAGISIIEENLVDTMSAFAFVNDVSCQGMSDGSILASVTGGIDPLVVTWDNGQTGFNPTELSNGIYTLTVQDACGQIITETYEVDMPELLTVTTQTIDETYAGGNNGMADCTPTGGTGPYTYEWNNGMTTANLEYLSVGEYCVTVTDAMGCTASTCDLVLAGPTSTNEIEGLTEFKMFPNPASERVLLEIDFLEAKNILVEIYSAVGQLLYEMENEKAHQHQLSLDVANYPSGIYFVKINSEGQQTSKRLVIKR